MPTHIHPTAIVHKGAHIGAEATIGPYCVVSGDAEIGDRVKLISHVVIEARTTLAADCIVHPFSVLGGAPQHSRYKDEPTRLSIGERNVIREHVSMHRAMPLNDAETTVGADNLFMAGSHVAHDCHVGNHIIFANGATLGGETTIGDHVTLGGLSAIHQRGRVGEGAFIGGGAPVTGDVIPFGLVDNHGKLGGLNIVGMKRRGIPREAINELRHVYRDLFHGDGQFADRLQCLMKAENRSSETNHLLDFISADTKRPLCMPDRRP